MLADNDARRTEEKRRHARITAAEDIGVLSCMLSHMTCRMVSYYLGVQVLFWFLLCSGLYLIYFGRECCPRDIISYNKCMKKSALGWQCEQSAESSLSHKLIVASFWWASWPKSHTSLRRPILSALPYGVLDCTLCLCLPTAWSHDFLFLFPLSFWQTSNAWMEIDMLESRRETIVVTNMPSVGGN